MIIALEIDKIDSFNELRDGRAKSINFAARNVAIIEISPTDGIRKLKARIYRAKQRALRGSLLTKISSSPSSAWCLFTTSEIRTNGEYKLNCALTPLIGAPFAIVRNIVLHSVR